MAFFKFRYFQIFNNTEKTTSRTLNTYEVGGQDGSTLNLSRVRYLKTSIVILTPLIVGGATRGRGGAEKTKGVREFSKKLMKIPQNA